MTIERHLIMKKTIYLVRKSDGFRVEKEISAAWDDIQAFAAMHSFMHGEEYYAVDATTATLGKYAVA